MTRTKAVMPLDTVICADCIDVMRSMPAESVDLIFADPPYFLRLNGDLRRPDASMVDAVSDSWDRFESPKDYDRFTRRWLTAARRLLKPTGTLWVIGSYHNIFRVGAALMDAGYWILNDVVWIKNNPMPQMKGVRFCNAHETLIWARRSAESKGYTFHYRELKAGNEDVQMRSDWYFPICSGRERETVGGKKAHSTQKPEALLRRIISATSNPGDVVLDPFCGSGTTAAAAKALGRRYVTIDREPEYVNVARARLESVRVEPAGSGTPLLGAPPTRVRFASLVEQGVLAAGTRLRLKGTGKTATVQLDGTVECDGLRGSIHKVAALQKGAASANGWTEWLLEDVQGVEQPLDILRTAPETV